MVRFLLALALITALVCPRVGRAEAPAGMTLEVSAGFDGFYRAGAWTPIFVSISNQPGPGQSVSELEDFKGQLLLICDPESNDAPAVEFSREIDIPPASTKRYLLHARFKASLDPQSPPKLRLALPNGRMLEEYPLSLAAASPGQLLVVSVGETISRPNLPLLGNRQTDFLYTRLSPSALPDHWAAWDGADVIVFPGFPAQGVSEAARTALQEWTVMGGTLVLLGGADTESYRIGGAESLLPGTLEGTSVIHTAADGTVRLGPGANQYAMTEIKPLSTAQTLASVQDAPVLVREPRGDGQVVFFALDLRAASLQLEQLLAPSWLAVAPRSNLTDWTPTLWHALKDLKALTGRAASPPNVLLIIVICLLYAFVMALNFLLLARSKKLELAWLTVPVIVLVFFTLIYGLGRLTKGGTNILRELTVERYKAGSAEGHALTFVNTFAAESGTHSLRPWRERQAIEDPFGWNAGDGLLAKPLLMNLGFSEASTAQARPLFRFDDARQNIALVSQQMGTYDAKTFLARGPVSLPGGAISARIAWRGEGFQGEVVNTSGRDYSDAWIFAGNRLLPIGAVKNGQTVSVQTSKVGGSEWLGLDRFVSERVVQRPESDSEVTQNNLAEVLEAIWSPPVTGALFPPSNGTFCFLGVQEEPKPRDVFSSLEPPVQSRGVVVLARIEPRMDSDAEFLVSERLMTLRLHEVGTDANSGGYLQVNDAGALEMMSAYFVASLELPFCTEGLVAESIQISPRFNAGNDKQVLELDVLEYGGRTRWVQQTPGVAFPAAGFALPHTGRVTFRVTVRSPAQGNNTFDAFSSRLNISGIGASISGRGSPRIAP